jgi:beta-phosphoglucomutase
MCGRWKMATKNKLAIFDLDGTLFDTKNVNFISYSEALIQCGLSAELDYMYYCDFCNGNNYTVFLPRIIPEITVEQIKAVHDLKKKLYASHLDLAVKNEHLFLMIKLISSEYKIALVTTASRKNTEDILKCFDVMDQFDLIITQEDVSKTKPDPECFLKAMEISGVTVEDTIIFEDSVTGLEAAEKSGAKYIKVYGYH